MTRFDKVIPPGSEGKVYATVDVAHAKGPIQKQITLATNDPQRPEAVLYIKAVIKSYVDIMPTDQVRFTVTRGEDATQNVTLVPENGRKIEFGEPSVNSDYFDVKKQPGDAYELKVSLKPTTPIGTQQAVVTVPASGLPDKKVDIPIIAVVRGPITVLPAVVSFTIRTFPEEVAARALAEVRQDAGDQSVAVGTVDAGAAMRVIEQNPAWYHVITPSNKIGWIAKSAVKTVKESEKPKPLIVNIEKFNGGAFKMLDYSANLPQIKVEKVPAEGNSYNLRVSLADIDLTKKANFNGIVVVKTDDAYQPVVNIPVYIVVS